MRKAKRTTDALAILDRLHFAGHPERLKAVADATLGARIAMEIYALRTRAGLTQKQLADLVGTTHSVISRLEDANYDGHSLKMLQRVAAALDCRLEIHIVGRRMRRKIPA